MSLQSEVVVKILIAGASGAIGQPLIYHLMDQDHDIYGITQSQERAQIIAAQGAIPLLVNVLERDAVFAVFNDVRPDIVVDMLTRLPKTYTPESMRLSAELNAQLRLEGGGNLLEAARMYGAKRYIAQSTAFWYGPGIGLADERALFAWDAPEGISSGVHVYAEIEKRLFCSGPTFGTALRFGFFYGPGTWFHPQGDVAFQIYKQEFPVIGSGKGVWNFVHIEDAAQAIVSAIHEAPGVYNIVNDEPTEMRTWLPAFAKHLGAPPPLIITEEEGLKTRGSEAVYYATQLRGASNAKAKKALHFMPRSFEWIS